MQSENTVKVGDRFQFAPGAVVWTVASVAGEAVELRMGKGRKAQSLMETVANLQAHAVRVS